ncbi:MAG TPA: signal peptidase I [Verrucomicrobiae bacterium]|nr:signal peptidase I [Verrucomicrobiae bacterium]
MWIHRWFFSTQVRRAVELRQQVRKFLAAQRDLLAPDAVAAVEKGINDFNQVLKGGGSSGEIMKAAGQLEEIANQQLKPYPSAAIRENVEMILVVGAIVMAFRCFFFQPMAIPSGSAQPTLWGIVPENLRGRSDVQMPTGLRNLYLSWVKGDKYYHVQTRTGGELHMIDDEPKTVIPFVKKQRFRVGAEVHTVWFPPERLFNWALLNEGQVFRPGEDVIRLHVTAGDHLFVNRVTYNFRQPRRGEIIVFESPGYPGMIPDTHYIKRLVALGGERVRIGDDRHMIVNGVRLDASTPHFENVYTFKGPPVKDKFSGHVNGVIAAKNGLPGLAPNFPDENTEYTVRPNHYLTFGDNTMNSADSRLWGDFPRELVIGKYGFVFWPITDRFGWGAR